MDFTLIKIGYIDNDNELIIRLDNKYQRALINVEKFSHLHVFYIDQNEIKDIIVKIKSINLSKGILVCENNYQNVNLFSKGKYELIDIKPYMPSEDSINYVEKDFTNDHCKRNIKIVDNNIKSIGLIRNVKGLMYLELDETIEINDTYLKVFWWFDKFDKPKLRELTMCNPPYEDAPQSGVFATRSPVRPNLIAMTIVKVVKKDDRLIYVNGIEGFDKTPIIGLCGYDINKDYIDNSIVPSYLPICQNILIFLIGIII